jgi:hypothetical protein
MKCCLLLFVLFPLLSCWKYNGTPYPSSQTKVWGNKPVYASESEAKKILYDPQKHAIYRPGNIYAFQHFIYQVDIGRGIHVIDNSQPAIADRIGFITVKGCEQISIKGKYLYTNSYTDLVTLDIADPLNMKILSRIADAFPEFLYNYPLAEPEDSGYYTCPTTDSLVVGWVKDSVYIN